MQSNAIATFLLGLLLGCVCGAALIWNKAYKAGHDQGIQDTINKAIDKIPFPHK